MRISNDFITNPHHLTPFIFKLQPISSKKIKTHFTISEKQSLLLKKKIIFYYFFYWQWRSVKSFKLWVINSNKDGDLCSLVLIFPSCIHLPFFSPSPTACATPTHPTVHFSTAPGIFVGLLMRNLQQQFFLETGPAGSFASFIAYP